MSERDIVRDILDRVMACQPAFTAEQAQRVEVEVRELWGGERVHIQKTCARKWGRAAVPPDLQQQIYRDGLSTASTADLIKKYGVSRATIYRLMKKGPAANDS